jgi:hypothetical protein
MAAEERRNRNEQLKEALSIRFRRWGPYTRRPAEDGHLMPRIRVAGGA